MPASNINPPSACCGNWSPDGKYFVFQSTHDAVSNIWKLPETGWLRPSSARPVQITDGPLSYGAPVVSRDSSEIYMVGTHMRSQLFRYDNDSHRLLRYLPNLTTATRTAFSPDGSRLAWTSLNGGMLWVSRIDGSQKLQLSPQSMQIYMMDWAPDGKTIVFMGRYAGEPWKIYTISSVGGNPRMLVSENRNEADPSWSPDGKFIAFGRVPAYMAEDSDPKKIYFYNVTKGSLTELPKSAGLFSPRWSPNGRYVAAITLDQRKLMIYDTSTQSWSEVPATSVDNPAWSKDGKYVYFHSFMEEALPIYRVNVVDKKIERIFEFRDMQLADAVDYSFQGLAPDNSPLLSVHLWTADIYSISWKEHR